MFTSGSTGQPKGVVIAHASVAHFVEWAMCHFYIGPEDKLSVHSPLHFDLSVFDIFGTLAVGAQHHLVPPDISILPHKLADFIRSSHLTQWFSVPSALTYMAKFDVLKPNDFPELKRLMWCSEVLPTPVLRYFMERLPQAAFTNLYGPTETTIASSYFQVPGSPEDDKMEIPIGVACPGGELLVLDDVLQPVPTSELGELYIGGVGLSPGYWGDPERTKEAFIPDPRATNGLRLINRTGDLARIGTDGLVYFQDRADSQIKSRGYRIDLGEVEAAMSALPWLQDSAVVASSADDFGSSAICAAYVPMAGAEVTPASILRELRKELPNYMIPSRWMALDALPHNQNDKVDRARLKALFSQSSDCEG
jgi:amino acid adenylation domain-containing protein